MMELKETISLIGKKIVNGLKKALGCQNRPPTAPDLLKSGSSLMDYLADRTILPGLLGFGKWGYQTGKIFWKAGFDSLNGKTVVITGATSGIGKAAAFALAELDARLIFIARDRTKASATQKEIIRQTGNQNIDFFLADLSLMSEIKKVARELMGRESVIDILINNAGALFGQRMETGEGFEKTFATNLLGVHLLTGQLAGLLSQSDHPRIINVSSGGMYTQKIDIHDLQSTQETYDGAKAYARTKRGLVILTELWAKALEQKGVSVHAMHPGWVDTPGLALSLPRFYALTKPILRTPPEGADTIVWLASDVEPGLCTGRFWRDRRPHVTHVFPGTRESEKERQWLWHKLSSLTEKF